MDVSTIIVSYDTFELTREAVRSALESGSRLAHEVIVVDNHSPDNSAERLRSAFPAASFPNVAIIANEDNPGFSAANNQGALQAGGRILFFLNPDTVVHADAIPRLAALLDSRPELGAVGPHVLNADGTDQPSTFPFVTARSLLWHHLPIDALLSGQDRRADPVPSESKRVDVVKGCALAVRRDAFDRVGGWDEAYFMYSEEVELCHALVESGYQNWFLRDAVITHLGGASTLDRYAEQQVVHQRSVKQFLERHDRTGLLVLNRVAGTLGFSARAGLFAALERIKPERRDDYALRGQAARRLARWFFLEYA